MAASTRVKRVVIVIALATVLLAALALALLPREPTYKGATIHEWLQRTKDQEQPTALVTLGTNNLALLVQRIGYDSEKDKALTLYGKLPPRLTHVEPVTRFLRRKIFVGGDAFVVLRQLGPRAAPAIPQLVQNATNISGTGWLQTLLVLDSIGDEAVPALITLTRCTNGEVATYAVKSLADHFIMPGVRQALTNALAQPDPSARKMAADILAGRVPH
jgi:hypothetical protein